MARRREQCLVRRESRCDELGQLVGEGAAGRHDVDAGVGSGEQPGAGAVQLANGDAAVVPGAGRVVGRLLPEGSK